MNFSDRYRIKGGAPVRLRNRDCDDTAGWDKADAQAVLGRNVERLADLQYRLYADGRRSVLIILQGMDASGKDGTIRNVLAGLNPQGCRVTTFKAPTPAELAHDFLWRVHPAVPAKGEIGVFNRSHYEDVLVVRVNHLAPRAVWQRRYAQINAFEQLLAETGTVVLKFFLHISPAEQKERLRARLDDPQKNWKFDPGDLAMREKWGAFRRAYEAALGRCSPPHAPWFVIPADKKWFRNLAVSEILVETLHALPLRFPKPKFDLSRVRIR